MISTTGDCWSVSRITSEASLAAGYAILHMMVTSTNEFISDTKIGGSLRCSGHAQVEFTILRDACQTKTKIRTRNSRKVNFLLFKAFVNGNPGKLPLGIRKQNKAGRPLRMLIIVCKT